MPDPGPPDVYPPEVASVVWLRTIDIFRHVPYQLLAELSGRLRPFSVPAGVRVVTEGEEGDELYIVRAGEVAVQHGDTSWRWLDLARYSGNSPCSTPRRARLT